MSRRSGSKRCITSSTHQPCFSFTFDYSLMEPNPCLGSFKFTLPQCFPTKIQTQRILINEVSGKKLLQLSLPVDDTTAISILDFGLNFNLFVPALMPAISPQPKSKIKVVERFHDEYLILNASTLLLPSNREFTFHTSNNFFSTLTISIKIDQQLLTETQLRNFQPVFLHLKRIINLPAVEVDFFVKRPFATVEVQGKETNILIQKDGSTAIINYVFVYRQHDEPEMFFKIHDRPVTSPDKPSGSGWFPEAEAKKIIESGFMNVDQILPQEMQRRTPCGYCKFNLLPPRKAEVSIFPEMEPNFIISPGNFYESQTRLKINVIGSPPPLKSSDSPIEHFESTSRVIKQTRSVMKPLVLTEASPVRIKLKRWVVLTKDAEKNLNFFESIRNEISRYHMRVLSETQSYALNTYNYEVASKKTLDLVTGFDMIFLNERLLIFEALDLEASILLDKIISLPPDEVTVLHDSLCTFSGPRFYSSFDRLIKDFPVPMSLSSLVLKDGVYNRKSPFFVLFDVIQKLNNLFKCESLSSAKSMNLFPTYNELYTLEFLLGEMHQNENVQTTPPKKEILSVEIPEKFETPQKKRQISVWERLVPIDETPRKNSGKTQRSKTANAQTPVSGKLTMKLLSKPIDTWDNGKKELWFTANPDELYEEGWIVEILNTKPTVARRKSGMKTERGKPQKILLKKSEMFQPVKIPTLTHQPPFQ